MRIERLNRLIEQKLVMIIRVKDPEEILPIVDYLVEAGVSAVEVTSNTPKYEQYIPKIKKQYPSLLVGAGTITNTELAKQAIDAGAEFLVTPNTSESVVEFAHDNQVPVVMGVLTPTDIVAAKEANADIIKLFPAEPLGPEYLKALAKGPFLDLPFFPVGGLDEKNTPLYLQAGAAGVGIGGSLASPVNSDEERAEVIERIKVLLSHLSR